MLQEISQKRLTQYTYIYNTIHMYSGITSGRVLNGELLYTKILEVNLFANKLTSRIFVGYTISIILIRSQRSGNITFAMWIVLIG